MAKFEGSMFGKASGKLTGLVFGRARTREGKVMTARELVIPLNPRTEAQQIMRKRFQSTLYIVTQFGPGIYRNDWNRSVGKLPGYQSLFSIFQNASISTGGVVTISNTPGPVELGELHGPETVEVTGDTVDEYTVNWSTELGSNGHGDDIPVILAVGRTVFEDLPRQRAVKTYIGEDADGPVKRSDGTARVILPEKLSALSGVFLILYFRPRVGSEVESPSPAKFRQAATGSTVFSTDFSEYITGTQPSGWSEVFDSGAWTIEEKAETVGGKCLQLVSSTGNLCGLMLDELGSPEDWSILCRFRTNYQTPDPVDFEFRPFGLAGKMNTVSGDRQYVVAGAAWSGGNYERFTFWEGNGEPIIEAGSFQSGAPLFQTGEWFWIRMEGRAAEARAKLWLDGEPEPSAWGAWTDGGLSPVLQDGSLGFLSFAGDGSGTIDFDVFQAFIP